MKQRYYVYIIRTLDFVKIGYTSDPDKRLAVWSCTLPSEVSIYALLEFHKERGTFGARYIEKSFHDKLKEHKHRTEWFHWNENSKEIVDSFIREIKERNLQTMPLTGLSPSKKQMLAIIRRK